MKSILGKFIGKGFGEIERYREEEEGGCAGGEGVVTKYIDPEYTFIPAFMELSPPPPLPPSPPPPPLESEGGLSSNLHRLDVISIYYYSRGSGIVFVFDGGGGGDLGI